MPCTLTWIHCTRPNHPALPVYPSFSPHCLSLTSHCQLVSDSQQRSGHLLTTLMVTMRHSHLGLTRSCTVPAGIQHCSRCHVSCTNQPEDLGSKPGPTGLRDCKQIRYWLKTNIISFKPSQPLPLSQTLRY